MRITQSPFLVACYVVVGSKTFGEDTGVVDFNSVLLNHKFDGRLPAAVPCVRECVEDHLVYDMPVSSLGLLQTGIEDLSRLVEKSKDISLYSLFPRTLSLTER